MKKALLVVLTALLVSAVPLAAAADTLQPPDQWLTFDGTYWDHKNGVRVSNLLLDFDKGQVNRLYFRLTPLRGGVVVNDVVIESGGQIIYRHSDQTKMNFNLHFFESAVKHYEQRMFFSPPLQNFDKATGVVKFYFTAGNERYVVTWAAADNSFVVNVIKD
ncbi:MAG: hypothetical protein IT350_11990 [Deltaproteobacteria bacterium]|nr:hypothetical protein [Deltaproteobacteria bacterium]